MIILRSKREIGLLHEAGKIAAETLSLLAKNVSPGISTLELDALAEDYIRSKGAIPSCKGYIGAAMFPFPGSICTSINEVIVHGIPRSDVVLKNGDIISLDLVVEKDGYLGDTAITVPVGEVDKISAKLILVTKEALYEGIKAAVVGNCVGDIGNAVSSYIAPYGYGVVEDFVGHGIGTEMHAAPEVPNYGKPGHGVRLEDGMIICIEPMINLGTKRVKIKSDGWTAITADMKRSAHFEHMIAVTKEGPIILTERS